LALVALGLTLLSSASVRAADSDPVTRVSEIEVPLDDAWHSPGYRLLLQIGYEDLPSWERVPMGSGLMLSIGSGWQVTHDWSVDITMSYLAFLQNEFLSGMRWSADVGPTWHPWEGLRVGAMLGYANMLANWSINSDDFNPTAGFCDGPSVHGMVHAGYLWPLAESFAMGPSLQAGLVYTKCGDVNLTGMNQSVPGWPQYDVAVTWILAGR